ncbi:MAG: tRNA pseudouridine(38-40) synthase TruA [Candidatus Riflebacteria bacterium HGW-Riflebacteria-2]|jgi:tRNA pseudouridine38-40 synthase|nr:MAG: tRNA pseudouridine(38-40) synthase TruA [Candidatus Riflebacteria bacterium HGW-Riflebacteria-2]
MTARYLKLFVTYDGSAFSGWQYQPHLPTVQGELERVIKLITGEKCRAVGAGRTDTGVHAVEQVVLLRTECPIPVEKLIIGMNGALPGAVRVSRAEEADEGFHPCFSARGKHYRYLFRLVKTASPFLERFFWQIDRQPDIEKMQAAAGEFIGEHDFAAFAKSPRQYESTVRKILETSVSLDHEVITFDVIGTGFMHNMVRNMAKAIYLVGYGEMQVEEIDELYRNQNRRRLGAPAPPGGLYLMKVMY